MLRWLKNVWILSLKELKSLFNDVILLGLIVVFLSVAVYTVAKGITTEVRNASVAIIDEDHSQLSFQIRDALQAPYFKQPAIISPDQVDQAMDKSNYVFVITIPANFERDVSANRQVSIQVLADATAVTQAGVGTTYLNQIIQNEVNAFKHQSPTDMLPLTPMVRVFFNPNTQTHWYTGMAQVLNNITLLAMILVGAAVIREKEHGTIEHLLVMPVHASEIAMSKILTNGLVITLAALLSLWLVVHTLLQVPINGSIGLYVLGTAIYLFSVSSMGICLATVAPTMPQFGLLCLPIYMVSRLLSGSESPIESMPDWIQQVTFYSPVTLYMQFGQEVLFRDAGLDIVWKKLLIMTAIGAAFLMFALKRFRSMLTSQG
ncbi:ABC transporter permease [Acinetobacter brisouii]|uniref:ABC transporter permease n=1 Tax=Acinetobacter brisouii TaxID=396323 RepID=UPI0005F7BAE3|nr:ABC transporter permease [Acinetobacter brisouii]KJV40633.1 membrane protein [Acinetobacter brisouii]